MDLTCPRCGEPNDNDLIHDEVAERSAMGEETTYQAVAAELRTKGCAVAFRAVFTGSLDLPRPCARVDSFRTHAAEAMYDLLGDDMDGAAAMLEDMGL